MLTCSLGCSLDREAAPGGTDGGPRNDATPRTDGNTLVPDSPTGGDDRPVVPPSDGCAPTSATDRCDGVDDDCNPATDDGSGDPAVGAPCDGSDADMCLEGVSTCTGGTVTCSDATGDESESCDGVDNDCNGRIDDGARCPCILRERAGHTYLFCTSSDDWYGARDACRAVGYELVTIDDADEDSWVATLAESLRSESWWIGLNDDGSEGTYLWASGGSSTYRHWAPGQPDNDGGEDCTETNWDFEGRWNDSDCFGSDPYVCEAGP